MPYETPASSDLAGTGTALEALGWTGREADWIALVCRHSGVFTRQQFCARYQCRRNAAHRFARRLAAAGVAREYRLPGGRTNGTYCHLHGPELYAALGLDGGRWSRRPHTPALLWRRLLGLDYVLEHPELPWLPTEETQVAHFESLGVDRQVLPRRLFKGALGRMVRLFPMGFPIAGDGDVAVFVYANPGYDTARPLDYWADRHERLWNQLRVSGIEVQVVAVVHTYDAEWLYRKRLAGWEGRPFMEPLTDEEFDVLEDIETAFASGDPAALDPWGGFMEARRLALSLREREEALLTPFGRIDGYNVHLAERLCDPFATRDETPLGSKARQV